MGHFSVTSVVKGLNWQPLSKKRRDQRLSLWGEHIKRELGDRDGSWETCVGDGGRGWEMGDWREESGRKNILERKMTLYGGRWKTVGW